VEIVTAAPPTAPTPTVTATATPSFKAVFAHFLEKRKNSGNIFSQGFY